MDQDPRLKRLSIFQHQLKKNSVDAAVLIHSRDLLYYTGTAQPCI